MSSKRCKVNEMKFMNLQSLTGIRAGIENGDFPEWLLMELLVKLSAKLVCRFKLVSKQWLSVISDPCFIPTYISRTSSLPQPWTLISQTIDHNAALYIHPPEYEHLEDIYSLVVEPSCSILCLPYTHQQQQEDYMNFSVLGVSNGLVLYDSMTGFYICNPVTSSWFALSKFTCEFFRDSCGLLTHVEDAVLKSYRVVRLEMPKDWRVEARDFLRFEVLFSETGEWKKFDLSVGREILLNLRGDATEVNGVLYWIDTGVGIIAYDPYVNPEHVRIIQFPDDMMNLQEQNLYNSLCSAYEGKLRYLEASTVPMLGSHFPSFKIWVFDDKISGGWSLQHSIGHMDIGYGADLPFKKSILAPVCFHPFDSDVVYLGWDAALVSYNIKTKRLELEEVCGKNGISRRPEWWWAFLLVIPSWPTSIQHLSSTADAAED